MGANAAPGGRYARASRGAGNSAASLRGDALETQASVRKEEKLQGKVNESGKERAGDDERGKDVVRGDTRAPPVRQNESTHSDGWASQARTRRITWERLATPPTQAGAPPERAEGARSSQAPGALAHAQFCEQRRC